MRKFMHKSLLFIVCLFFLPVLGWAQIKNPEFKKVLDSLSKSNIRLISIQDFKKLDKRNVYLLDAREREEYDLSHLRNSRPVGYFWFDMRKVYNIPHDATIIVYCAVGNRGQTIAEKLVQDGYQSVYNLYGGIFEWVNQGNPVYKSSGVQTSEVHLYNKKWAQWLDKGIKE